MARGYFDKLLSGAVRTGKHSTRRINGQRRKGQPRRGADRLNPPPQDGWKIVTVAMALLVFGGLSIAGLISNWADWTLIPFGFFCGSIYFAVQIWLSWKKDRLEDYGDLLQPRLQRGRPKPNQKEPEPFVEYSMRAYLAELGSNFVKLLTHHRVIATGGGFVITAIISRIYDSYWVTIPVMVIAVIVLLTISDIVAALFAMSMEERHALYKSWGEEFLDAMAMSAIAHPGACSPEMAQYLMDRYQARTKEEEK